MALLPRRLARDAILRWRAPLTWKLMSWWELTILTVFFFACSCWLSLEGGLLYAFVGPAAAVVLVRFSPLSAAKRPKNAHLRLLLQYWRPYILLKAQ